MANSFVRTNLVGLRTDDDDQFLAEYWLTLVWANMSAEAYHAWSRGLEGMTWAEKGEKARDMLDTLRQDTEQRDYRDTMRDTRIWARGG